MSRCNRIIAVGAVAIVAMLLPVLALAQGYEPPNTVEVPAWVLTVIGWFANKWTVPVAFGAIVLAAVAILRQVVALFGAQLGDKGVYLAGLLFAFLTSVGEAAADGKIAGQEWVVVGTALATFVAAVLGYKLLFSGAARARLGK